MLKRLGDNLFSPDSTMVVLFTDFGLQGPYVGLLKLAVAKRAPAEPIVDLFHDVPPFEAQGAAYLLAAYVDEFPPDTVFIGVVDPGVGSERPGLILEADKRWFVGPDNGLFDRVAARAQRTRAWHITWRPERLSASFHGRDLFAPIAALLATGTKPNRFGTQISYQFREWPEELTRIVYVDHYGNGMTGIRAGAIGKEAILRINENDFTWARTFAAVTPGQKFWYENSSGLIELAVNQGSAAERFGLHPGIEFTVI